MKKNSLIPLVLLIGLFFLNLQASSVKASSTIIQISNNNWRIDLTGSEYPPVEGYFENLTDDSADFGSVTSYDNEEPIYDILRTYFAFDTSSLEGLSIASVKLFLKPQFLNNDTSIDDIYLNIFGGSQPIYNGSIFDESYWDCGTTLLNSTLLNNLVTGQSEEKTFSKHLEQLARLGKLGDLGFKGEYSPQYTLTSNTLVDSLFIDIPVSQINFDGYTCFSMNLTTDSMPDPSDTNIEVSFNGFSAGTDLPYLEVTLGIGPIGPTGYVFQPFDLMNTYLKNKNFVGFVVAVYTSIMGELFYGMLILIITLPIYLRTQSLIYCSLVWLVLGSFFAAILPPSAAHVAYFFIAISVTSILYKLFTRERD